MDAIDYAESAGDLMVLAGFIAFGLGAVFAIAWWWQQAGTVARDLGPVSTA